MTSPAMKKWSRGARTRELTRVLGRAGFERRGDEWILDTPELRWWVYLGTAKFDPHEHGLSVGATVLRDGHPLAGAMQAVSLTLRDLPGASRRVYRDTDEAGRDPLLMDVEALLIPLITRLPTIESVITMLLAGEITESTTSLSRPYQIAHAWKLAKAHDKYVLADRAVQMAEAARWTSQARWLLVELGMPVSGPVRENRGYSLVDRLVHRAYVRRFSPITDETRLPV
ncbi:hypothetical protein [Microbacterium aquilitoris]|uniref:hypothetical protein n=1 Tax=Microbacterium aquilitoris TaxID=3067307 RepID=UPI002890D970|nr:hypothetical protein [Microbacterium sp. KSW2-22]MDT3344250.1 hypothetical protein [Microbacterium sp. KSW2-22]